MTLKEFLLMLGTAHFDTTPGKNSPDGRFREEVYSREIISRMVPILQAKGFNVLVDYPDVHPGPEIIHPNWKVEQRRELTWRCNWVNRHCAEYGAQNCLYLSIHNNAAKGEGWHNARGTVVYVHPKGSQRSRRAAQIFYDEVIREQLQGNRSVPETHYWHGDYAVLRETKCPAILTENGFQNNLADVDWLLSETGKETVTRMHVNTVVRYAREVLGIAC